MPGNIGLPSRSRDIRFSRSSSFTRREPRRCAVKGLWRNSPRVRAELMVGTSEGDSLMRIIPPHRLLLCQMSRAEEKILCCESRDGAYPYSVEAADAPSRVSTGLSPSAPLTPAAGRAEWPQDSRSPPPDVLLPTESRAGSA